MTVNFSALARALVTLQRVAAPITVQWQVHPRVAKKIRKLQRRLEAGAVPGRTWAPHRRNGRMRRH